jgi:hypothetical protein
MKLDKLLSALVGDILILDDFMSLTELGHPLETEILAINSYSIDGSSLSYRTLEIKHNDLDMTLVIKTVNKDSEIRMYTTFDEGSFYEFVENCPNDSEDQEGGLPTGFILDPNSEGSEDEYLVDDPFPLYGFIKNDDINCGIGEYTYNGDADETYWAKHAFIEWYISDDEDDDDMHNYYSIAFGWDVCINDLNILQG